MTELPAVSLRGILFAYGSDRPGRPGTTPAFIRDLRADIPAGSVTAVLGPNGSGKTTLLHLITGLLSPGRGEILFFGSPRSRIPGKRFKRMLGLVPQQERIPFDLSLLEYTLPGRAPHLGLLQLPRKKDRGTARSALEKVGLSGMAGRSVPLMSGGERQLAGIARALAQETDILLLDEPTAHLDLANTRRVLEVLASLSREGKTVIFSIHDPNAAAAVADHALLLKAGEILASGPPATLFSNENLTRTYGIDIEVVRVKDRPVIVPFDPGGCNGT